MNIPANNTNACAPVSSQAAPPILNTSRHPHALTGLIQVGNGPSPRASDALRLPFAENSGTRPRSRAQPYTVQLVACDGSQPGHRAARPERPRWQQLLFIHMRPTRHVDCSQNPEQSMGPLIQSWTGRPDKELTARWDEIIRTPGEAQARNEVTQTPGEPQARDEITHTPGVAQAGPTTSQQDPGKAAFRELIEVLAHTHIHSDPNARKEVAQWLVEAANPERAAMLEEAFRICEESNVMCRDNALLTWNRLKMLMCKDDALAGRYASKLTELCLLALNFLRIEALDGLAQERIIALHKTNQQLRENKLPELNVDPVEIMLDYHVSLRDSLNLPFSVQQMAFPTLSHVTEEDRKAAKDSIARIEEESFHLYLMLDFTPFRAEVQRQIGPDECDKIVAALPHDSEDFGQRVRQRLKDLSLPADFEAFRSMGVQIYREIAYEAWLPHANAVLAEAGLAPLPPITPSVYNDTALATQEAKVT